MQWYTKLQLDSKADDTSKIAEFAQKTTVQINNSISNKDSPGGSGVIIAKQDDIYTVLTANHVVCDSLPSEKIICSNDISYSIHTYDGKEYLLAGLWEYDQGNRLK